MILFLLAIIAWNGFNYFWPKKVVEITLSEEDGYLFRGGPTVAGVITQERGMIVENLAPNQGYLLDQATDNPDYLREIQLYTGNRDVYGQTFAYLNKGKIESIEQPKGILMVERLEWGNAILFPRKLVFADGTEVSVEDPEFDQVLRRELSVVRERRSVLDELERRQMGRINLRIDRARNELRYFNSLPVLSERQASERADYQDRIERLNAELQPLLDESDRLRAKQQQVTFHFVLPDGAERSQPMGDVVNFYYPNAMSVFDRWSWFFFKIWEFLTDYPREANTEGGIFPALFGTLVMTILMSLAVTPFGVLAAVYLREYAKQGPLVSAVRISINNLAGVPAIVFGVFGLGFFIHVVGAQIDNWFFPRMVAINTPVFGTGGILWASLTLALMTVPVVIVATEEALAAVPRGVREGSLACGASKWQTIQRLVLPASSPGILTGLILAMARGAGEVAPLLLVGVMALAPSLPVDDLFPFIHLDRKFMHLGFHIYIVALQSPDTEATKPLVFASTLVLIMLVVVLNLTAILIRNHLRKKYMSSTF
ncbi:MAG: phosphate ABC transporter permease PstA [Opitutales bacterium]|nr:phosphate ABC transporter permease PstA [Opitutales bacterium]